ncbi:MAG: hypothetical protein WB996_14765 [Ignavibacteriaceae bacterium]
MPNHYKKSILYADGEQIILKSFRTNENIKTQIQSYFILEFERYKEFAGLYSFLIKSKWIGNKTTIIQLQRVVKNSTLVENFTTSVKI